MKPNLRETNTRLFHGFYPQNVENVKLPGRFLHGGADVEQHEEDGSQQLQQGQGHLPSKDI